MLYTRRICQFTSAAGVCVLIPFIAFGQDEDDEDGRLFELSPFTVDAADQSGYTITSTTAGTRLRTNVKDLGAQIDVFSTEFLDDIAASDPEEAFLYSLNVENEMENPDYGDGNRARFERDGPAATARGLGNSRTTGITTGRNFFETQLRTHNYNIESLSIASGPNSILFGLGQSGGTINSVLKRASVFDDFGQIGVKIDNHGTWMITTDYNKVLIEDKVALRVAFLDNNEESYMEGNYDNQERWYATATVKFSDKAILRLHYEDIEEVESPTQYRMFQDNISPWMRDGGGYLYDPADGARPRTMNGGSGRETIYTTLDGKIDLDTLGITKWNNQYGARSDEGRDYIEWVSENATAENGLMNSYAYDPGFLDDLDDKRTTFSPESLELFGLPFKDVNPWGDTMRRTRDATITTAFFEFNPVEDLFIELGYNEEDLNGRQFGYNRSFNYGVFVDTQRYLPNGEINPNAGELFMQDDGWGWETPRSEEEFRVTLSYEYDFEEKETFGEQVANFLGRHRLALLYSDRDTSSIRANSFQIWKQNSDGTTPSFLAGGSTRVDDPNASWLRTGDRRVSLRQYIVPENGWQLPLVEGWDPGAALLTLPDPGGTGLVQATMWDPDVGSNRTFSFDRSIESQMLAYQAFLWDNRLILTYGKREDDVKQRELADAGERATSYSEADFANGVVPDAVIPGGYFPWWTDLDWGEYGESFTNSNETKGAVFRPLGIADWLSIHYNEASNNGAGEIRFDIDGTFHDPITGTGEDYGFRIDLFDDTLAFKWNKYETDSQNLIGAGGIRGVFTDFENLFNEFDPDRYTRDGFDIFGQTDLYLPVEDRSAEGEEYTLIYRPLPNWNMRFTAAKTKSVRSNIYSSYIDWGLNRASEWSGIRWNERDLNDEYRPVVEWRPDGEDGTEPTREELIADGFTRIDPDTGLTQVDEFGEIVVYRTRLGESGDTPLTGWENIPADDAPGNWDNNETLADAYQRRFIIGQVETNKQLEGISNPNVRKWRMNFTTSYQFEEGALKGWRIGGSARFRDKGVIGFGRKTIDDGENSITVLDIGNPFYNDSEYYFDAMVAYRGTLNDGKLGYRVQLNVRNLTGNDDLYPTDATTTGRRVVWAGVEPRTWILSTTFDF